MGQNKWYKLGLLNQGSGEKKDVSGSHLLLRGIGGGGRSNCTHSWIYSGFSSRNHLQTMQRTERQFTTKVTVIIVFQ